MLQLHIGYVGFNVEHDQDFCVDRPTGSGDYVFIHFQTPIQVLDSTGKHTAGPGSCIMYAPPHAQWYTASEDSFIHDWIHCDGPDLPGMLDYLRIPLNTVFYPAVTDFISPLISSITREEVNQEIYNQDSKALLMSELCIQLARGRKHKESQTLTPARAELLDQFRKLRYDIHQHPEKEWDLKSMAAMISLSASRFGVLYKEFFGIPAIEDVIERRMHKAAYLLSNTALAVKEIAELCGFSNIYYFSRLFKKRFNCKASEYNRRKLRLP